MRLSFDLSNRKHALYRTLEIFVKCSLYNSEFSFRASTIAVIKRISMKDLKVLIISLLLDITAGTPLPDILSAIV